MLTARPTAIASRGDAYKAAPRVDVQLGICVKGYVVGHPAKRGRIVRMDWNVSPMVDVRCPMGARPVQNAWSQKPSVTEML